jgi:hypothetical protein
MGYKGMIGTRKLHPVLDIPRLKQMINEEPNNAKVAREFTTTDNEKISREMVSSIRSGKRWNINKNSFTMKDLNGILPSCKTTIDGVEYKTITMYSVGQETQFFHFINFKNNTMVTSKQMKIYFNTPTQKECLDAHLNYVYGEHK